MEEMAYFKNYLTNLTINFCFSQGGAVLDIGLTYEIFILERLNVQCFPPESNFKTEFQKFNSGNSSRIGPVLKIGNYRNMETISYEELIDPSY